MSYEPKKIEKKWQEKWLKDNVFAAKDDSRKQKFYQLETFPYPSGAGLHVGHPKGYIAEDIHARYMRMRGKEVLYTMGWDAFGLPTENYAIKVGKSPKEVTKENTDNFRRQVRMFGFSYDWDREINTSLPEYYKWTQWLFIQLFKSGLAYRDSARVNWCPKDQTVLANEQVINGKCERCGSEIEERDMEQWFLKITDYAERLLSDLKGLDWPAATIKRQEDWIGKSEGALIKFQIQESQSWIEIFTTRPDTIFGATYLVLAPEHPLINELISQIGNQDEVRKYIEAASHKTERMRQEEAKEKTGVELKGITAVNPATKKEIPVWVADYVLGSYGTGAIMAVPAHDKRDFEFAKKFHLPVVRVVEPKFVAEPGAESAVKPGSELIKRNAVCAIVRNPKDDKYLCVSWKGIHMNGLVTGGVESGENPVDAAIREVREETGYKNIRLVEYPDFAIHSIFYHRIKQQNRWARFQFLSFELENEDRDPVDEKEAQLHEIVWKSKNEFASFFSVIEGKFIINLIGDPNYIHTGEGILHNSGVFNDMESETAKWKIVEAIGGERKIQYKIRDWSVSRQRYWGVPIPMIHCPQCAIKNPAGHGIVPVSESELPVILPDLENYRPQGVPPLASSREFIDVKCPVCGSNAKRDPETLDTFVDSSWYYLRYTDPHNSQVIFDKQKAKHWLPVDLYVIGAEHTVLHLLYSRFIAKFLSDQGWLSFKEPFIKLRHQGLIRGADGQKMSKSKGNVVNPDEIVGEFGADTVRMYEMFMGPFEDGAPWDPKGILGIERFLRRFWKYATGNEKSEDGKKGNIKLKPLLHRTIKKVGEDIEEFKFNTAISALMILLNECEVSPKFIGEEIHSLLKILHPFAPHMAQELWAELGNATYLDFESWPEYDPAMIKEATIVLVLQVNGKTRDTISVDASITEDEARSVALANENVKRAVGGSEAKKIIYIDKKLINIVI